MRWLDTDVGRVWYRREGAGEPLLFLHHGDADHRLWDHQMEYFRRSHDVIAPDLLGFGRSDKPAIAYALDLYVRTLEQLLVQLGCDRAAPNCQNVGGS